MHFFDQKETIKMTNTQTLTQEELGQLIIQEAHRTAINYARKSRHIDVSEMESYLISKIYHAVLRNDEMSNIRGVRQIAKRRAVNYINHIKRHNVVLSMDGMVESSANEHDASSDVNFADYGSNLASVDPIKEYHEQEDVFAFVWSLPTQERQVVEMTAGITDSLDKDQFKSVRDLIDRKAVCNCGTQGCQHNVNVWFTASEVGKILGLTRRQVQYILSKLKEKVLDFGLDY
jgi:hypothetical protein